MQNILDAAFRETLALMTPNFYARYFYGNKIENNKGIKNMHLNIRSLSNKVFELKNIVKEHRPHILGISECELRKTQGTYDESKLKILGYKIFFPKYNKKLYFYG